MMDPAVKTAMAFCVLLGGMCAATLFRRDGPQTGPVTPSAEEQLLLRCRNEAVVPNPPAKERSRETTRRTSRRRPATVVTPMDRHEPPPSLAPDYPEPERQAGASWNASMKMMLPTDTSTEPPTTHTVVDGDTLATLAKRYLGSANRAQELYEANREVLHDPMLLPIGVELKLPPRERQTPPQASLVPVAGGH